MLNILARILPWPAAALFPPLLAAKRRLLLERVATSATWQAY